MKKINGYEVIDYIYGYITKNYNGAKLVEEKSLKLENFLQSEFKISNNNCSLVSITRLIKYQEQFKNKDTQEIFDEIYTIGMDYGFREDYGTFPTKIDNIMTDFFNYYNINVKAKGKYFSNFYNPVKSEIDANRPLLMSIAFGDYHNHTVTVTGYKIFKYKGMNIKFIELLDGWKRTKTYIDYNVFAHGITALGVCSFNTLKIIDSEKSKRR